MHHMEQKGRRLHGKAAFALRLKDKSSTCRLTKSGFLLSADTEVAFLPNDYSKGALRNGNV